ncbi:major allergen Pru ar 1 [Coffea arabica]|uniref:Major allergen Pru ar 1 n=1 Tax=Coffea arabica TaxID=13443 RepID=A0A6P6WMV3_COFAR|nr:major allergen Pru ar 1-like [Coffea arabica]XP_027115956.1 major allergen Pru ar 1-like [Coffea arabica]
MGVITYDHEVTSSVPPAKLFKAFILDFDNLIPKILPQAIKSVETLQGDGGAGTVKLTHFGEGSQYKSMKHRVDELDKENFAFKYTVFEGDVLGDVIEKTSYEVKIEASADGGSITKSKSTYYTKDDAKITEEDIKSGKDKSAGVFKAIEAHLAANPDAY